MEKFCHLSGSNQAKASAARSSEIVCAYVLMGREIESPKVVAKINNINKQIPMLKLNL
jgi:hypothetical protein